MYMYMCILVLQWNVEHWKIYNVVEQGAEGIHADFNNLKRRFSGICDPVEHLRCTMTEHHLRCSPCNIAAKPPTTKRPKVEEQTLSKASCYSLPLCYVSVSLL